MINTGKNKGGAVNENIPAQTNPNAKCFKYGHPKCLRLLVNSINTEDNTPMIIITGTITILTARPTRRYSF